MASKGGTTRDRLLAVGLDAISVEGLSGITLGGLASAANMSKSGLFAHFASKERLQLDLLDAMAQAANVHVVAPALAAPEGLPRLSALVENWLGWSTRAGLRGGCPIAAALFELDDLDGEVREKVVAMESQWRMLLRSLVNEAVMHRHINADVDAEQFVWELCGIYLSHHASSRLVRDAKAMKRARVAFEALLRRAGATLPVKPGKTKPNRR
jgi:AcrR family transcriptional regulator